LGCKFPASAGLGPDQRRPGRAGLTFLNKSAMTTSKLFKLIIPSVLLLLIMAGCAGVGQRLEPPRVKLANIRIQEVSGFETVFDVQLRVFNFNDVALDVKAVECELEINGKSFATGVSSTDTRIPAYGTQILPMTVYSSVFEIIKSVFGLQKEEHKLRLTGKGASGRRRLACGAAF
jgi:LEA14-like dessication related protein